MVLFMHLVKYFLPDFGSENSHLQLVHIGSYFAIRGLGFVRQRDIFETEKSVEVDKV